MEAFQTFQNSTAISAAVAAVILGSFLGVKKVWDAYKKKIKTKTDKPGSHTLDGDQHQNVDPKLIYPINLQQHSLIHERITELRLTYNANFVTIAYFHNGGNFLDGSPMKRISAVYESLKQGKDSLSIDFKNIFVSELVPTLKQMDQHNTLSIPVEKMTPGILRTLLESKNIVNLVVAPITKSTQIEKMVVGLLFVGYGEIPHDEPDSLPVAYSDIEPEILAATKRLAHLLEIQILTNTSQWQHNREQKS